MICLYRWVLLPVVTTSFASQDLAAVRAKLDGETFTMLREIAFTDFPVPSARREQVPDLATAYMFAWHDVWTKREDLKTEAVEQACGEYAREIEMLDGAEQFTRYGHVFIDTQWQELSNAIRDFYAAKMLSAELPA